MIQVAAFEMSLKLTSNSIASEFVRKRCSLVRVVHFQFFILFFFSQILYLFSISNSFYVWHKFSCLHFFSFTF